MKGFLSLILGAQLLLIPGSSREFARVTRPNPSVRFHYGKLLYLGHPFTGAVLTQYPATSTTRHSLYVNGMPDGEEVDFFASTQIIARRYFHLGEKVATHRTWFPNGARRTHASYLHGEYDGEVWEWYQSGPPSSYVLFENGHVVGKKQWREDGAIYSNQVFLNGRPYGVPGSKLCLQVRR